MECLGCRFELTGLPSNICPECSRPFDPGIRTTFAPRVAHAPPPPRLWLTLLAGAALSTPFLLTLWLFAAYAVARLVLGRWPHLQGADDPKSIPIVQLMLVPWTLGTTLALPAMLLGLALLSWHIARRARRSIIALILSVMTWPLAIALNNQLVDVWGWFLD